MHNILNVDKEKNVSVFAGVGERTREGQELYEELKRTGTLPLVSMLFGTMGASPAERFLTALAAVTVAEHFRDNMGKNVLFFIDNMYRFAQAGNELSMLMNMIPSEDGYQAALNPETVTLEHYASSLEAKSMLKKAESLDRIVSLVGESELGEEDRILYRRAKKLRNYMTQSFFVAEEHTDRKGKFVPLATTVEDVRAILRGDYDEISEDHFLFVGEAKEALPPSTTGNISLQKGRSRKTK